MPTLAVLLPLMDTRGDVVDHLRTWTHEQTLSRERYQVIVAAHGHDPQVGERVRALMQPQDAFLQVVGRHSDPSLWNEAAAHAAAPWLLITEAHCLADPSCLEAVHSALNAPAFDAGVLRLGHVVSGVYRHLFPRWFEETFAAWAVADCRNLPPLGTLIRREAFQRSGGFDARYGDFSEALLSARVHQQGLRVVDIDAVVRHIYNESLHKHHAHSANYTVGECSAREDHEPAFAEHYFGYDPAFGNRLRYQRPVAREAISALGRLATRVSGGPGAGRWWTARELLRWLPAAAAGTRAHTLWERLAFTIAEFSAERLPLPRGIRYRIFVNAHQHVVRLTRLRWIARHPAGPLGGEGGPWTADQLPGRLVGVHGLESHGGRRFRWTEPVALLRLHLAPGKHVLRIDTGGLRGETLDYVHAVFLGDSRIPRECMSGENGQLLVRLSGSSDGARRPSSVMIVCRPLDTRRSRERDRRRLGMPVFTVTVEARDEPVGAGPA